MATTGGVKSFLGHKQMTVSVPPDNLTHQPDPTDPSCVEVQCDTAVTGNTVTVTVKRRSIGSGCVGTVVVGSHDGTVWSRIVESSRTKIPRRFGPKKYKICTAVTKSGNDRRIGVPAKESDRG